MKMTPGPYNRASDESKTRDELLKEVAALRQEAARLAAGLCEAEEDVAGKLRHSMAIAAINETFERDCGLDEMLTVTLEKMLSIFKSDRAWLLFPVDVTAPSFKIPYQVTTPEYAVEGMVEIPIEGDEETIGVYKLVLASKEPVAFNFDEIELPEDAISSAIVRKYRVRSQLVMALHPRVGEPWMLGLHQCSYAREWSKEDRGLFKDISARITDAVTGTLLYKDLEASEGKFRSIFESSNDAIMLLGDKGFLDCNAATLRMFGCSGKEEFLDRHPSELSPPVQPDGRSSFEAAEEKIAAAYLEGRNFFEWTHRKADGEDFPAEVLLTAMRLEGRDVIQATVRDITERKRAVAEKEQLQAQLIHAQKMEAIGTLAGGIAHDFNNILTVVKNLTSLALNRANRDPGCTCYLEPMREVCERGISLVQQLLIFSQNKQVELSCFNMNDVIDGLLNIISTLISEDISVEKALDQDLWDIKADRGRIEQVITNLVINGRDAMLTGGSITLRTKNVTIASGRAASIHGASPGRFICLTVEDTGKGMDEDTIKHIFEPFFTTKAPKGTGLGLSVVYGIVEDLGGWINVESRPGRGSKFKVYFPVSTGSERAAKKEPAGEKVIHGGGRRILLVEDDKWVRKSTAMVLSENGYAVVEASSAEQALSLFCEEKGRFDLVMSDVVMSGKSGLQMVRPLLDANPDIPILLCSGHLDDKAQLSEIINRGIAFLHKPYRIDDMLKAVEKTMKKVSADGRP